MRTEPVEIYSDASNAVIMRHPGRRFPGLLLQGDMLHSLALGLDSLCVCTKGRLSEDEEFELCELRDRLQGLVAHYRSVLREHDMQLPFNE